MRKLLLLFFLSFVLIACTEESNIQGGQSATLVGSVDVLPDLFTPLESAATGIDFVNAVKSDYEFNYMSYSYLFNGAGIGVIDYDNDGLQDLYFISNQGKNVLYKNLGEMKFTDVTDAAGVAGPVRGFSSGVSIADVDGDGFQDIYVGRTGIDTTTAAIRQRENLLFMNNGDGTFTERGANLGLNSNHPATQATFFDFDNDGDLDLYQVNTPIKFSGTNGMRVQNGPNGPKRVLTPDYPFESDQLFRNDGDRFVDITAQAGLINYGHGLSAAIGDFNRDGRPDIYVGNDFIIPDHLYINQGDGTFKDLGSQYLRHTSHNSMGSDLGDVNNDGMLDLVSLDMLSEDLSRQKQLDNAMRPDRYNSLQSMGYGHQLMRNQLQVSNGQGFFEIGELAGISNTDWSWAPLFVDFDQDGNQDLFVSNGYRYDLTDMDFMNFTTDSIKQLGGIIPEVFPDMEDFMKLIPTKPQSNYLYRNAGNLRFNDVTDVWNVGEPAYSGSAVYADLDGDGDMDLVVGNHERPPFVYRNNAVESGKKLNWLQVTARGPQGNIAGFGVEVTASIGQAKMLRTIQPVRGFMGSNEPLAHFGLGAADNIDELKVTWPNGNTQVLRDVAANQRIELNFSDAQGKVLAGDDGQQLFNYPRQQRGLAYRHAENQFSDFDRQFLQPRMLSREGPALAVADVNGDGLDDVFLGAAAGAEPVLFEQQANGTFQPTNMFKGRGFRLFEDVVAHFLDIDQDGDPDLYVGTAGNEQAEGHSTYRDRIYLNTDGELKMSGELTRAAAPTNTGAVTSVDYDGDGDLDLIVGGRSVPGKYPNAPVSFLLRNDGGTLVNVTQDVFPDLARIGMVTAIASGDVTGNGSPEIVIAGEWMPIGIYVYDGRKITLDQRSPKNSNGFWQSLQIVDLDGDGRGEIIAGNQGLNTRFRPEDGKRVEMYAADFDGNDAIEPIIVMDDENGQLAPVATKAMFIKQLPGMRKKYVRTSSYSKATITDIFKPEALASADHYTLDMVSSGVFKAEGDDWIFQPFPSEAQVSTIRSILPDDFNGDGQVDLLMVGNDYRLQVETGRIDSGDGVLLLGDGAGNFTYVPNREHGFWASLDARHVAKAKLAGGKEAVIITNNGGPSGLYEIK